jgi:hypothetical protein
VILHLLIEADVDAFLFRCGSNKRMEKDVEIVDERGKAKKDMCWVT